MGRGLSPSLDPSPSQILNYTILEVPCRRHIFGPCVGHSVRLGGATSYLIHLTTPSMGAVLNKKWWTLNRSGLQGSLQLKPKRSIRHAAH